MTISISRSIFKALHASNKSVVRSAFHLPISTVIDKLNRSITTLTNNHIFSCLLNVLLYRLSLILILVSIVLALTFLYLTIKSIKQTVAHALYLYRHNNSCIDKHKDQSTSDSAHDQIMKRDEYHNAEITAKQIVEDARTFEYELINDLVCRYRQLDETLYEKLRIARATLTDEIFLIDSKRKEARQSLINTIQQLE